MSENVKLNALKEILYGAGISFVLGMIGYVLMFFFKLIAARYFGPAQFGMYEMLMTIFGVAVVFGDFGIVSGIQRYISEYESENKKELLKGYLKFIIYVPLAFSLLVSMLVFIFSTQISGFFNFGNEFTLFLRIISLGIPMRVMSVVINNILFAKKDILGGSLGHNIIEKIILLLGIFLLVFFKLSILYLIIITFLSILLSSITSLLFLKKTHFSFEITKKYAIKEWVIFSLPLIFTGILAYVLNWTDNFIIGKYSTPDQLGIYGVSFSLAGYLLFIVNFFAILFLPSVTTIYLNDKNNFQKTYNHVIKWIFITNVFFGSILIIYSKKIIELIFGPEYISGALSLSILGTFFVLSSLFSLSYSIILLNKKTNFFLYNYLSLAIFNLILNMLLINKFGIAGIAFASGLSAFLIKFFEFLKAKNKLEMSLFKIILIALFDILFIKLIFRYVFTHLFMNELIQIGIALLIYGVIFLLGLFIVKVFNYEDMELMLLLEKKSGLNLTFVKKFIKKIIK